MASERIKSLGGPGGIRCNCCGSRHGKVGRRQLARWARRLAKSCALLEECIDLRDQIADIVAADRDQEDSQET